jgi:hypothetical protein
VKDPFEFPRDNRDKSTRVITDGKVLSQKGARVLVGNVTVMALLLKKEGRMFDFWLPQEIRISDNVSPAVLDTVLSRADEIIHSSVNA